MVSTYMHTGVNKDRIYKIIKCSENKNAWHILLKKLGSEKAENQGVERVRGE